jgi:F420-dependent oxidoreductase-like protein
MELGLLAGAFGSQITIDIDRIRQAESAGFTSVWTAEAYGSDAVSTASWILAQTEKIKVGTAIMQMPARSPAMTAMTAMTLNQLSGGRFLVGLGPSGPQVIEGWHGMPYSRPAARIREYVEILHKIWDRQEPVSLDGKVYQLPYQGEDASGLGKPLKSILHSRRLPVYLATMKPLSIRITAELADGWLPIWFSPYRMDMFTPDLEKGFARAGSGKSLEKFDILAGCTVVIGDDVKACLAQLKPTLALYVGGMGAKGKNFHNEMVSKYGYADVAAEIQDLYLSGRKKEATELVPDELCDEISLCGPPERIRERFKVWESAGISTMMVQSGQPEALALMADIAGTNQ